MQTRVPEINNVLKKRCVGFTKRILLSTLFVLPGLASPSLIAAFAQAGAPAATQTTAGAVAAGQRKSITDLSAKEIMSLRRGVAKMKSRDNAARGSADYRRSWIYWANMHLHFGDDCAGPITGSGMAGVQLFTATNADEQATWCKCEHGTVQFLTWHRMYLFYFERVLQEAAGDSSLRIPYWDYETNARLPAAYRETTYVDENGHHVPNPLRVEARQPGLNNGTASLSASVTSTRSAMRQTTYARFNPSLEQTPHGAVHCAIVTGSCPNGLMGSVPVAAIDPIFYAHHTNLDRLYECWLGVNESARLPHDQNQLNTTYTFVDTDGSTKQRQVRDMLTTAQLQYSYGAGGGCPQPQPAVAVAQAAPSPAPMTVAGASQPTGTAGPTRLSPTGTTVPLAASPSPAAVAPQAGAATPGRTYLLIDGVKYDEAPGGLYDVYLQNAGGQREHIGVINFFNLAPSAPSAAGAHAGHAQTQGSFRFDVTDAVKELNLSPNVAPSLVFVPSTGLSGPTQGVAAQESVAPQMNAQANVRFESARLVNEP